MECCNPEIDSAVREARKGKKVKAVSLFHCVVDDGCAARLPALKHLEWLELNGTITNVGLAYLQPLTRLKYLDLSMSQAITDAGLASLADLGRLEVLKLKALRGVTNAGLASLSTLKRLKVLELFGTSITEAGLVHLRYLSRLERLDLPIGLTQDSLPKLVQGLGALPRLKQVGLAGPYWEPEWGEPEE
jgi:hypothetical protein